MGALGAGAGAGEARTRAEAGGATEGQRAGATALGSVVGISEMFLKVKGSSELITAQDRILLKQVISASSLACFTV
jgi:hypothetical protein